MNINQLAALFQVVARQWGEASNNMKIRITSLDNIREAAKAFLAGMGTSKVVAFYGKMGAGKTTFIKAICEELGVEDVITSPTFALGNDFAAGHGGAGEGVVFSRSVRVVDVCDLGYEDYFYGGNLCLLEWPELIEDILPDDAMRVSITEQEDGSRVIESL